MTKLYKSILIPPAVLIVLIMRLLHPFITIRWGRINIARIGCITPADWYLSVHYGRMCKGKYFDIFYFEHLEVVSNKQWWAMWKRVLRIFPFGRLAEVVVRISRVLPDNKLYNIPTLDITPSTISERKNILERLLKRTEPNIAFTPQEERFGHQELMRMGISKNIPFVCFHARDAAYLDTVHPYEKWDYHDYRDSNILNYIPAVEELTRRGYLAIRMGSVVKDKLSTSNSAVIDYASNGNRTDFLDVYLGAKCDFFLCSDTGLSIIPETFKRHVVYVNWVPIGRIPIWVSSGIYILKKFYSLKENRDLTIIEIMQSGLGNSGSSQDFETNGIQLRENTLGEIMAVVIEMEDRLKGKWKVSPEDGELQKRFWACLGVDNMNPNVRIGAEFLRQNKNLLSITNQRFR